MKVTIRTYQIGLAVLGVFTLVLTIWLLVAAAATRQDAETEKAAQDVASKLNDYTTKQYSVPSSLNEAGVGDVPDTIKYTRLSSGTSYKFCVTYKTASSGFDASNAVTEVATGDLGNKYSSLNDTKSSNYASYGYLYLPPNHKKGENCQTITLNSYNSNDLFGNYNVNNNYGDSGSNVFNVGSGIQSKSRDTERQTDLKTLQSQLEAYYAENGYYPTLQNLNDLTWVATNMKGMDKEALRDPQGTGYTLQSTASKWMYGYSAKGSGGKLCDNTATDCISYVLTGKTESGSDITYNSLN